MKRRLRMGMVGGGQGAMIGQVHRLAAQMTGRFELTAGSFSSNRQKSYDSGKELELPVERVYGTYREMLKKEARLPEDQHLDFVAIVAPNNMHYPISMAALDAGFNILCERPMTTTLDEALNLRRKLREKKLRFCLTTTGTGFPMLLEARELLRQGRVGEVRKAVIECPQGWMATRLETAGNRQAGWRTDPRRAGPSGCLADAGAHGVDLLRFVTGLQIVQVCADARACIPGRQLEDDGSVMMRLSNGAHALLWASHICVGETQGLTLRIYGDKGAVVWSMARPEQLLVHAVNSHSQLYRAGDTGLSEPAGKTCWLPGGLPEGYLEALANIYRDFADDLDLAAAGKPIPAQLPYPTIDDGARSVAFVDAVVRNLKPENTEKWTGVETVD
ncbi:MAG: Gfo/Idh/MocA family oxidoreductase [Kiritimatiellae bacterium]|nr:Gfo/Idh/MocA family oxidoreductase [Kiritimatiellia bacterium]